MIDRENYLFGFIRVPKHIFANAIIFSNIMSALCAAHLWWQLPFEEGKEIDMFMLPLFLGVFVYFLLVRKWHFINLCGYVREHAEATGKTLSREQVYDAVDRTMNSAIRMDIVTLLQGVFLQLSSHMAMSLGAVILHAKIYA